MKNIFHPHSLTGCNDELTHHFVPSDCTLRRQDGTLVCDDAGVRTGTGESGELEHQAQASPGVRSHEVNSDPPGPGRRKHKQCGTH